MDKTKEKISKNLYRDEIGMYGNIPWQLSKSFPKVAKKSRAEGGIYIDNSNSNPRIDRNINPP